MSTLGEGGMVTTNDPAVFERVALYRSHCTRVYGRSTKYCSLDETQFPMGRRFWWQDFDDCGYNFRLTDVQGAVGRIQLRKLDELNGRRIDASTYLTAGLRDVPDCVCLWFDPATSMCSTSIPCRSTRRSMA
jgi:perosamine synthetase